MSRFYTDDAGRVLERATGALLGRIKTLPLRSGLAAIYFPYDARGHPVAMRDRGRRSATMIFDLAMLAVVRTALPGEDLTLGDLDE